MEDSLDETESKPYGIIVSSPFIVAIRFPHCHGRWNPVTVTYVYIHDCIYLTFFHSDDVILLMAFLF
jgi:hypothetical protein